MTRVKHHIQVPQDVQNLSRVFQVNGLDLYLVGGAVRDAVQGREPKDWDLATSAPPDRVQEVLRGQVGYRTIPVGEQFGVVRTLAPSGEEYEIATFREDGAYTDGRRPDEVKYSGIDQDVQRRDLTINALFYDLSSGEVVDLVGGLEDLNNNVIRAVGDPRERFGEDRLRILRVLRFAARTGGRIDPGTLEAIRNDPGLRGVSPERVRDEFQKGVKSAVNLQGFLDLFGELGLWGQVFPGLQVSPQGLAGASRDPVVLLAVLLQGNSPQAVKKGLAGLKYTAKEAAGASFLVLLGQSELRSPEDAWRLWKLWKQSHISPQDLLSYQAATGKPSQRNLEVFLGFEPSVSGEELLSKGFKGKELGQELDRIEVGRFRDLLGEAVACPAIMGGPLQNILDPDDDNKG